jgi:hypothetical protein
VTIVRSGGKVLGNRPLELDGVQPELSWMPLAVRLADRAFCGDAC